MTLTEFLLARIAEDEAVAMTARDANGSYLPADGDGYAEALFLAEGEGVHWDVLTHAARFDPARVLADCEAKRRIVEEASAAPDTCPTHVGDRDPNCEYCWTAEAVKHAHLRAVATLANVYADHPDYRDEWRI